jgi:Bifunctional DNA primase/polymerase, N-terminal
MRPVWPEGCALGELEFLSPHWRTEYSTHTLTADRPQWLLDNPTKHRPKGDVSSAAVAAPSPLVTPLVPDAGPMAAPVLLPAVEPAPVAVPQAVTAPATAWWRATFPNGVRHTTLIFRDETVLADYKLTVGGKTCEQYRQAEATWRAENRDRWIDGEQPEAAKPPAAKPDLKIVAGSDATPSDEGAAEEGGTSPSVAMEASEYLQRGWSVIKLKPRSKKPALGTHAASAVTFDNIHTLVDGDNIGIRFEENGDLKDVDLDFQVASDLAGAVGLTTSTAAFGRASVGVGHLLYNAPGTKSQNFDLPEGKYPKPLPEHNGEPSRRVLEIRGGSDNTYTMFPPSVHPCGETLEWCNDNRTPTAKTADEVRQHFGRHAVAATALYFYPQDASARYEVRKTLSAVLVVSGMSADQAGIYVQQVARLGGDPKWNEDFAARAEERMEDGKKLTGIPKLCEVLGLPDDAEKKFREWLCSAKDDRRPMIIYSEMRLPEVLNETQAALIAAGVQVYQSQGRLVRPMRLKQLPNTDDGRIKSDDGIIRDVGSLTLCGVNPKRLHEDMIEHINFVKISKTDEGFEHVPMAPPEKLPGYVLARSDKWTFSVLTGIVQTPTMTGNGRVIDAEGYDAPSGIIIDLGSAKYPKIPDRPTQSECKAELAKITKLYEEFPLVQDDGSTPCGDRPSAARSAAVSGVLTALIRKTLPGAPQNVWDSAGSGSGKTLGINVSSLIATGHRAAVPQDDSSGRSARAIYCDSSANRVRMGAAAPVLAAADRAGGQIQLPTPSPVRARLGRFCLGRYVRASCMGLATRRLENASNLRAGE